MKRITLSNLFTFLLAISSCTYEHVESFNNKCSTSDLALTLAFQNATSCGATDGRITAIGRGGSGSHMFNLNDGTYQSSGLFSNLPGGSYTVNVKDSLGCTASQIISVNNDGTSLVVTATTTSNTGCPTANGTISVSVAGGVAPLQYKLNSNSFQSSNSFSGLSAGTYSVTVMDATNCQASATVTINRNGPSFSSTISPIISGNCATSGCHNGSRSPNLSSYSDIKANGASIVSSINRNMPPNGSLTQTQINEITCWVSDGAPNN